MIEISKFGEVDISKPVSEQSMSVLIGGDVYLHGAQLANVEQGKTREIIADVILEIENSDFSIVNLEASLTELTEPILKSGPAIKMPPSAVKFLTDAGIDAVTLANNHTGDYTPQGLLDTLETLDRNKIKHVGAGKNLNRATMPLKWETNGISMAIISIAENEFGVAEDAIPGMAPFDIIENLKLIKKTSMEVDVLIVIAHGGTENYPIPRPELTKFYRAFADAGATAVVAHHPHCTQGMEIYNGVPIVYSLGNFVFPSRNPDKLIPTSMWHFGYMVKIEFSAKRACKLKIIPYSQFADGQNWYTLKGERFEHFLSYFSELSEIITDNHKVKRFFDAWTSLNQERLISWLGWKVTPEESHPMLHVKNEFWCEAHCELAKNILMLMQKNKLEEAAEFVPELDRLINAFKSIIK
jgi:Bacterial capsule synthesis protein PGA_cap